VCEANRVSRQRSSVHKVLRSRALFTVVLRGSAPLLASAGSSIKGSGVCRSICGQFGKQPSLQCCASAEAGNTNRRCAKQLSQLRQRPACGNLTTHSSGPSCFTLSLPAHHAAAQFGR
jgi:hypothetical protein